MQFVSVVTVDRKPQVSPKKFLGQKQSKGRLAGRFVLCSLCCWLIGTACDAATLLFQLQGAAVPRWPGLLFEAFPLKK